MHNGLSSFGSLTVYMRTMSPDATRVRGLAQWIRGRKRSRYYLVYTSQRGGEINCARNPVCSENADELHENLRDPSRLVLLTAEVQVKRLLLNADATSSRRSYLSKKIFASTYFRNYVWCWKVSGWTLSVLESKRCFLGMRAF